MMPAKSPSDLPNCTEIDGNERPPLPAHDFQEIDRTVKWEVDDYAAYKVTSECRRDECGERLHTVRIVGRKIETVADLKRATYQIYESYYDNPRAVPYRVMQLLSETDDPGYQNTIADILSSAAKIGCLDADRGRDKKPKRELIDTVLPV